MRSPITASFPAILILIVCGLACPLLMYGETATTPPAYKTEDANIALKRFQAAEAKAKAEYDKAVAVARTALIKDLEAAKDKATKAGDLDEAVKLRDKIKELQAEATGVATTAPAGKELNVKTLLGGWAVTNSGLSGWKAQLDLREGGVYVQNSSFKVSQGTWKTERHTLVLTASNGDTATYTEFNEENGVLTMKGVDQSGRAVVATRKLINAGKKTPD